MNLIEGQLVKYKNCIGTIVFITNASLSILVNKGRHRSHDVRVVVYQSDFNEIEIINP